MVPHQLVRAGDGRRKSSRQHAAAAVGDGEAWRQRVGVQRQLVVYLRLEARAVAAILGEQALLDILGAGRLDPAANGECVQVKGGGGGQGEVGARAGELDGQAELALDSLAGGRAGVAAAQWR